jgi:hypothetical protein
LKAASNCLKFSSIGGRAMFAICLDAHFLPGGETLFGGDALPVAVFFVLHFHERGELAEGFSITAYRDYTG